MLEETYNTLGQSDGEGMFYGVLMMAIASMISIVAGVVLYFGLQCTFVILFFDNIAHHAFAKKLSAGLMLSYFAMVALGIVVNLFSDHFILLDTIDSNSSLFAIFIHYVELITVAPMAATMNPFIEQYFVLHDSYYSIMVFNVPSLLCASVVLFSFLLSFDRAFLLDAFKNSKGEDWWWRSKFFYTVSIAIAVVQWGYSAQYPTRFPAFNTHLSMLDNIILWVSSHFLIAEPSILTLIDELVTI
ncbi:hypothetical protein FGO68_gene9524 [Halteria grandinella]|uniref:Uncharacterized protein n=1 Tax=Halteria grandinella TaxID=5974 RepID=A0A8J8SZ70_HALGN|nr:hypothetical protein FGO68_gene9524 [Halteria grandinella]